MGTVYEAERLSIGGLVAIKVLHPDRVRDAKAVRRFHKEARAAAAIGHPNICEVHDLGALEDGSPYLVMERLMGETLGVRLLRERRLPFDEAADVLIQVLSALSVTHQKGIVHRDIKPANIFLSHRLGCPPLVKVLDFGISKVISAGDGREETRLTHPGMVVGTIGYMSLEQAYGAYDLDARVDLYACGVIFYEMLTGRRPFPANNIAELLPQLLKTDPPAVSEIVSGLPDGIDEVIDRAMARSRDERYASAHDLQRDLQVLRERSSSAAFAAAAAVAPNSDNSDRLPTMRRPALRGHPSPPTAPEAVPSSLDIPIEFTTMDTPPSGETLPEVDLTTLDDESDEHDTVVTPVDRAALATPPPKPHK
jgi:serine/threonine-protein kinase